MIHQVTGIPDYINLFDAKGYWRTDHVTQQMIVDELRAVPALEYTPGDHFEYSNSNYVLLAEIVAKVSGTDFATFLRRRIFDPLGLNMVVDAINPIPGRAVNYDMDTGVLRANDNERWEPIGDGALQTTPSELVRWADNYRKPRVGGPSIARRAAGQLGRDLPGWSAVRGRIVRRRATAKSATAATGWVSRAASRSAPIAPAPGGELQFLGHRHQQRLRAAHCDLDESAGVRTRRRWFRCR